LGLLEQDRFSFHGWNPAYYYVAIDLEQTLLQSSTEPCVLLNGYFIQHGRIGWTRPFIFRAEQVAIAYLPRQDVRPASVVWRQERLALANSPIKIEEPLLPLAALRCECPVTPLRGRIAPTCGPIGCGMGKRCPKPLRYFYLANAALEARVGRNNKCLPIPSVTSGEDPANRDRPRSQVDVNMPSGLRRMF
jgi:hypothetical protein